MVDIVLEKMPQDLADWCCYQEVCQLAFDRCEKSDDFKNCLKQVFIERPEMKEGAMRWVDNFINKKDS